MPVVIKKYAASLAGAKGRLHDLELMERVEARGIEKIMARKHQSIPMCANVDLYSGLIYSMLEIPRGSVHAAVRHGPHRGLVRAPP